MITAEIKIPSTVGECAQDFAGKLDNKRSRLGRKIFGETKVLVLKGTEKDPVPDDHKSDAKNALSWASDRFAPRLSRIRGLLIAAGGALDVSHRRAIAVGGILNFNEDARKGKREVTVYNGNGQVK